MSNTRKHRFLCKYCKSRAQNNLPNFCKCPVLSFSLAHASGTQGGTVVLTFISGPFLNGQFGKRQKALLWQLKPEWYYWPSPRSTSIHGGWGRSKSFCISWISHDACIEENILSDGFYKVSCCVFMKMSKGI